MTDVQTAAPVAPAAPSDEVIAQHVRAREIEIHAKSRLLAGVLLGAAVWLLAANNGFDDLGQYSAQIAAAIAFVVGFWMGDRAVFAVLGGVVTYYFMRER